MNQEAIEVEAHVEPDKKPTEPTQAVILRSQEAGALSTQRMTVEELKQNLAYIREVMQTVMKEDQDYGKVPGCGDKPSLLQPGAQKLCMTFQLQDRVRKEEVKDLPGFHREYSFTICLVSATSREWDGVGTCSTLESKYRYRKAERRCPKCGTNHIMQGKAEFGGGWICWKKKGGCGEKFPEDDARITSQEAGTVEYENPPDYWNTVRKMAFKRALVHAAINATNTSELWTQDVEEMVQNTPPRAQAAPGRAAAPRLAQQTSPPAPRPAPPAQRATAPLAENHLKPATEETRKWMLAEFKDALQLLEEYFQAIGWLLETEELKDLALRYVPNTKTKMKSLKDKLAEFGNGEQAGKPYESGEIEAPTEPAKPAAKPAAPARAAAPTKPIEVPRGTLDKPEDQDAWRTFPMPFGKNAGVALRDLEKNYLFGLWANYTVETEFRGKAKRPEVIAKDQAFRAMLDLAGKHYEFKKND